ncbi:sensor histidine kinase [Gottfriedia acidiceleris]|uniref:sensor histidine kinase n=1 Tax=Gottfriedia acidiceleris TaxID=371036 RepID=UPI00101C051D|nr:HAMP domain-containing sensor histidine kinase [Gottfriedia acidiceleris]
MIKTKSISFKLGLSFLLLTIIIETLLFSILYFSLVNTRVNEEIRSLINRGNSHRDVLEKHFTDETIKHVALMESEADTKVIVQSISGEVLGSSHPLDKVMREHLNVNKSHINKNGTIIHSDWRHENYISTISPITVNQSIKSYVYMFQKTESIQHLILRLKIIFIITMMVTFIITLSTILYLSGRLTRPLIKMIEETDKMAKGDLSVSLNISSNDEVSELADAIQHLASELSYMKNERNEFLATVAHELRTPLTFIRGYADIAQRDTLDENERQDYLKIIKEETDRITDLVQELLLLAQIEQHSFAINKTEQKICELLESTKEKLAGVLMEKHISITLQCDSDCKANVDIQRFNQVLQNLIMNSYQYAYSHSTIKIKVKTIDNFIQISIQDQGVGIPPEDIPHIFKRFYRVDKSRTRSTGGTGLGLAIVKEIVELHGGTVSVNSEQGIGTTFFIKLPR